MPATASESSLSRGKVFVTGATGFIGSALVRHLRACDIDVLSGVRPSESSGSAGRPADILRPETLTAAFEDVDVVIHTAGLAHQFGRASGNAPFMQINAQGAANVAQAAASCGVRRLILASSVSVYGSPGETLVDESFPCTPATPYASSKLEAERCTVDVAVRAGMQYVILRFATVYGEGDRGNVARLMRALDRRRFVWIGAGSNRKSLIHCDDVARAFLAALERSEDQCGIYNVAGHVSTMKQVVEGICASLGREAPRWRLPAAPLLGIASTLETATGGWSAAARLSGILRKWLVDDAYDDSRFRRAFGYAPVISLEDGLRRQALWYLGHRTDLQPPARSI